MLVRSFLSFAALVTAVSAQWSVVAPAHYAQWEGTTASSPPFSGAAFPIRTQQIHIEPKGAVRTLQYLAFRRDARAGDPRFASRTVDIDLWMGHGTLANATNNFLSNYTTPRQNVLARQQVNTPDYSATARLAPSPFDFRLLLGTPFVHNGVDDLVWEVNLFGATGPGTAVALDGCLSGMNLVIPANYELNGLGCAFAGNVMELRPAVSLQAFPVNAWILDWIATSCPPSSPVALLLGVINPNLPVPGLCTNLYALPLIQVGGVSDASGGFDPFPNTAPAPRIAYAGVSVGLRLEAQVAAVDTSGSQLRLLATNGASSILPPWTPQVGIARVYETTTAAATLSMTTGAVVQVGGQ